MNTLSPATAVGAPGTMSVPCRPRGRGCHHVDGKAAMLAPEHETCLAERRHDRESGPTAVRDDRALRVQRALATTGRAAVLATQGLKLRPSTVTVTVTETFGHPDEGTGGLNQTFATSGLDAQVQRILETEFDVTCQVVSYEAVGPQLR